MLSERTRACANSSSNTSNAQVRAARVRMGKCKVMCSSISGLMAWAMGSAVLSWSLVVLVAFSRARSTFFIQPFVPATGSSAQLYFF